MHTHHQSVMDVMGGVDRFFRKAFTSITVDGPALDAREFQRHPHMIVSTHRSHVDYFLAGHTLIFRDFVNLRFAAGDNLTNLPLIGPKFRAFGAFTVEREIAFERGYVKKLCLQVAAMMENREAVILFPEGGRSYSGAMLEVKTGVLGAAVLVQAKHPAEDAVLLPMAISYEYSPDARWFSLLLRGKKLRKRTQPFVKRLLGNVFYFGADILAFAPFLLSPKIGRTYGAAHVDYGAPMAVRELLDIEKNMTTDSKDDFFRHRVSMQQLSTIVRQRFIELYRLLPLHLVAAIVRDKSEITAEQVKSLMPPLFEKLRDARKNVKSLEHATPAEIADMGIRQLLRLKAVRVRNAAISVRKRPMLDYCAAPVLNDGNRVTS